jgi:hypothetical protein
MRIRMLAVGAIAAAAAGLAGCAPAVDAPTGISVAVYQPRTLIAAERMSIQVRNDGDDAVEISAAALRSTAFAEDAVWPADHTVRLAAGTAVDLNVDIPAADCSSSEFAQVATLIVDGAELELEAADEMSVLPALHERACLVERVEQIVVLSAVGVDGGGLAAPAQLLVDVAPTGADGTVTLLSAGSTTLLMPSLDGLGVSALPLDVELGADGPTQVRIPIVPNRCDAHALAEDKVGTRIPLEVETSTGAAGRFIIPPTDDAKGQLQRFYAAYCGL